MKKGDHVIVQLTDTVSVEGFVVEVVSEKAVKVKLHTTNNTGFEDYTHIVLTKRKNGSWHRRGVMTGRGWKLVK